MNENHVEIQYPNGAVYKGQIDHKNIHGSGVIYLDENTVFHCSHRQSILNGKCILYIGNKILSANFYAGKPKGKGTI